MSSTFNFPLRLKTRMAELNLNQTDLAIQSGMTSAAISQFCSGKREPGFNTLVKLSDALDCSTDYLFGKTDTPYHDVSFIENDPILKEMADGLLQMDETRKTSICDLFTNLTSTQPVTTHV